MLETTWRRTLWLSAGLWLLLYLLVAAGTGRLWATPPVLWAESLPLGRLDQLQFLLGMGILAFYPGLPLSLSLPSARPLEPVWLLLKSAGLSFVAYLLHVNMLKALSIPVSPGILLLLGTVEVGVGFVLFRRRPAPLQVPRLDGDTRGAFLLELGCVLVAGLLLTYAHRHFIPRSLGAYWYHPAVFVEVGESPPTLETQGVSLKREGGWQALEAERPLWRLEGVTEPVSLELSTLNPGAITLRYLWRGPLNSRLTLDCEDLQSQVQIERAPVEVEEEGPTLRYLDEGLGYVYLELPLREARRCVLRPETSMPGVLLDVSDWPDGQVQEAAATQGWVLTHYYQILNIAENVAWAREVLQDRWVTLNQPPLWSYVFSAVMVFGHGGTWALNLFFLAQTLLTAWLGFQVVRLEQRDAPGYLLVPLLLVGASHARIIIGSGSTNFPDNLYALLVMASVYALLSGRAVGYGAAATLTTLVRYPGVAVMVLLPLVQGWLYPGRRRGVLKAASAGMVLVGVICVGFVLVGSMKGQLPHWLEILYFETFPEHFHGDYALSSLLPRPPEFYGLLLQYLGYTPLLLVLARTRLAWLTALTCLLYTFLLCFIDHFPSHYFITPMYLLGVALVSTCASQEGPRRLVLTGLACVGLGWGLTLPM
ncbi:MAG: hypothetical protein ACKO6N_20065 [Myxococcota bacterium]